MWMLPRCCHGTRRRQRPPRCHDARAMGSDRAVTAKSSNQVEEHEMGLAWQQAPFGQNAAGQFLVEEPLPEHILYAEPAGRRMRVELAGAVVALSDGVTLLHETG